ncbi:threonine/serine exporter ThrE family protein [Streptomyces sp. NPDC051561]|uniref:threonine/serine exporter ThrE family protein n=1 Tax=Streptomyces sp. NPDC051561 TaxID=3365658 RepID=UPI0037BBDBB3
MREPRMRRPAGERAGPSAGRPGATALLRRFAGRASSRVGRRVGRLGHLWDAPLPPEPDVPPPPQELVRFLRDCGAALCRAGETTDRVQQVIVDLAGRYGMRPVHAFVLPTGVFVRVGDGAGAVVDFASVSGEEFRLNQIEALYRFLDEVHERAMPPREGTERLRHIEALPVGYPPVLRVLGYMTLTIGLGLLTYPSPMAVLGYAVLGLAVGTLRELFSGPLKVLVLALPVVAAVLVTVLAYRYSGPVLGESPTSLVIPPLMAFLPGATLTLGMMELSTGSVVSGTSRLVYGTSSLVLLTFGITVGAQLMRAHEVTEQSGTQSLGAWAPWAGAALLGVGLMLSSSAPLRTLPWLLLVLCLVETVQLFGQFVADALVGAFLGGVALPLLARLVEHRRSAPPSQVTFLPAFWLLVPGSMSLTGVGELITGHNSDGLLTTINALLTVVAVGLGVMVGSSTLPARRAVPTAADGTTADDEARTP